MNMRPGASLALAMLTGLVMGGSAGYWKWGRQAPAPPSRDEERLRAPKAPAASARRPESFESPGVPREELIQDLSEAYATRGRRARIEIYIGEDAKQGEFQLAGALLHAPVPDGPIAVCGAALFRLAGSVVGTDSQWILTAAHCAPEKAAGFAYGSVDLGQVAARASFDRVCLHPDADTALVRLKDVKVQAFAPVLKAVALTQGSPIEIMGWGETYRKETTILQHAPLTFDKTLNCGRANRAQCFTATSDEDATVCRGDSGSPALLGWQPGQPDEVIAGVATRISSCGGNPSQFVSTTPLIPWIELTLGDPSTCKVL